MSVPAAYILILLVWSTTPLTIVWSSDSFSPMAASTIRLAISLLILLLLRVFVSVRPLGLLRHWKAYGVSAIGLFPGLALMYWAAPEMSSGLMSVVYGTVPFFVVGLEVLFYRTSSITGGQLLAILLAFIGLIVLVLGGGESTEYTMTALMLLIVGVIAVAISTLGVKAYAGHLGVINMLTGSLIWGLPCFAFAWLLEGAGLPDEPPLRAIYSILYLAVMGSCVSYLAYYYLLRKISAASVSLSLMITPAAAMALGVIFNDESFNQQMIVGVSLIMSAIWIYQLIATKSIRVKRREIQEELG